MILIIAIMTKLLKKKNKLLELRRSLNINSKIRTGKNEDKKPTQVITRSIKRS